MPAALSSKGSLVHYTLSLQKSPYKLQNISRQRQACSTDKELILFSLNFSLNQCVKCTHTQKQQAALSQDRVMGTG